MKSCIGIVTTIIMLLGMLITAYIANQAIDIYVANKELGIRTCVIIDAGHGGLDGGAVSCSGVEESKINLQIALRLNDLMHLLGVKTYMIRTEDVSIYTSGDTISQKKVSDLRNRVKIINDTPNAILISIHQNYYEDSRYSGAQVFYKSDSALAKNMQDALVKALNPGSTRKIKKASGIYLMQNIDCPAALIECGFLSNRIEERKLLSNEYQKKLVCVIGCVTSCFINNCALT